MGDLINLDEKRKLRKKVAAATEARTEPQALETFLTGAFVAAFPSSKPTEDPEC